MTQQEDQKYGEEPECRHKFDRLLVYRNATGDYKSLVCGDCGRKWQTGDYLLAEVVADTLTKLRQAKEALEGWEKWEADMILYAGYAWWDLQTREQNNALVELQYKRNAALHALQEE